MSFDDPLLVHVAFHCLGHEPFDPTPGCPHCPAARGDRMNFRTQVNEALPLVAVWMFGALFGTLVALLIALSVLQ